MAVAPRASRRSELLEFAVLGLLHDSPMHGYELRRQITTALGTFRALSYGSLYPCLRDLVTRGLIRETPAEPALASARTLSATSASGKRAKIVYELTADGKERFGQLIEQSGPNTWDDDDFDVRFAFFGRTDSEVRLRILEGRRSRVEERLETIRETSARNRERLDAYTTALQRHGEESTEREVRWLEELITNERKQP